MSEIGLQVTHSWLNAMPWQWIGDPTPIGWTITLAYFVGAGCAFAAFKHERTLPPGRVPNLGPRIWFWIAIGLAALAVNKQLDVQILASAAGRRGFEFLHLSHLRRVFQAGFALCFAALALFFGVSLVRHTWRFAWRYRVATLGVLYLGVFVVTRAASFQHLARVVGPLSEPVWRHGLELLGIGTLVSAALAALVSSERPKAPPC